jgi:hypothetical protein
MTSAAGLVGPLPLADLPSDCLDGLSLNLLSFRLPAHVLWSDAAEHAMGDFCAISGRGWRLELPVDCRVGYRDGISLNLFEFLGGIVSV